MNSANFQPEVIAARIETAIRSINPDLRELRVLTEAASGPYLSTAVLAAAAGAEHVFACTRDSSWGRIDEIAARTLQVAAHFGIASRITVSEAPPAHFADRADVVTNLGFVRPINLNLVKRLPPHAAVSLMWEPWEFRAEDVDVLACSKYSIPIIATNEQHPCVATFGAVGMLALKLLLECQYEVYGLTITVVGSPPFGPACAEVLSAVGANVVVADPLVAWNDEVAVSYAARSDAMVLVEHRHMGELLGPSTPKSVYNLEQRRIPLVHICGGVDADHLESHRIMKHPSRRVPLGYMTVTTAHIGPKAVVDLHAAGLHAGAIVANGRRAGLSIDAAVQAAVTSGFGLRLEVPLGS